MKKSKLIFPLFLLVTATFFFACGGGDKKADTDGDKTEVSKTDEANQGPEFTSAYICPMNCKGSGSDKAGTCPVCNMAYVSNENYQGDNNDGHDHDGHDHDDHDGHSH